MRACAKCIPAFAMGGSSEALMATPTIGEEAPPPAKRATLLRYTRAWCVRAGI